MAGFHQFHQRRMHQIMSQSLSSGNPPLVLGQEPLSCLFAFSLFFPPPSLSSCPQTTLFAGVLAGGDTGVVSCGDFWCIHHLGFICFAWLGSLLLPSFLWFLHILHLLQEWQDCRLKLFVHQTHNCFPPLCLPTWAELNEELLCMRAPRVGQDIKCLTQPPDNLFLTETDRLLFLAEMCWMSSPTPRASCPWTWAVGSNMPKPPTNTTTPNMFPCNFNFCRWLFWWTEEFHMCSFGTQKMKALCIWVCFL